MTRICVLLACMAAAKGEKTCSLGEGPNSCGSTMASVGQAMDIDVDEIVDTSVVFLQQQSKLETGLAVGLVPSRGPGRKVQLFVTNKKIKNREENGKVSQCTCTWDAEYPCDMADGMCWGYKTASSCEGAGGTFCGGAAPLPTPSPRPPPSGGNSGGGSDGSFPHDAVLRKHNIYRCMHNIPLMSWNEDVASQAQAWADHTKGDMKHGGCEGYGQNLAGLLPEGGYDEENGVKMWYDEVEFTNDGLVDSFGMNTGHYTQVVWKATTEVGCGKFVRDTCGNGKGGDCLLVCCYKPPGNYKGQFQDNVKGPVKSQSECETEVP